MKNKLVKQFDNVKEPGDFEQPFPYNDSELKMEFRWDYEANTPLLLLDGIVYEELPFLAPDFKLDEQ